MAVNAQSIKDWLTIYEILGCQQSESSSVQVVDGIGWVYDDVREKWLSINRLFASAGRKGRIKNAYLRLIDGQTSNLTGYRMIRNATITAIAAQTRDQETWSLHIRKNGNSINIATLDVVNDQGAHNKSLNIDIDENDQIQFYAETLDFLGVKDPFIWIEIAWRNDDL